MDYFVVQKKSASLSSTQWPLPFGQSALYICPTWGTELYSLRLTVLRLSDLGLLDWPDSWAILYGLHPFKVIFFLYWIKDCLCPQTTPPHPLVNIRANVMFPFHQRDSRRTLCSGRFSVFSSSSRRERERIIASYLSLPRFRLVSQLHTVGSGFVYLAPNVSHSVVSNSLRLHGL